MTYSFFAFEPIFVTFVSVAILVTGELIRREKI